MPLIELTEGWTGDIDMQLQTSSGPVNLTGSSVVLLLRDIRSTLIPTSSDLTIFSATDGKVRYNPDSGDLAAARSPYKSKFKVTDGSGKVVYFPSGRPDEWLVYSA